MPELPDLVEENARLNTRLIELEKAQYALATAGINDSAKWEQERDALLKEHADAQANYLATLNIMSTEIATLHAELGRYILLRKSAADEINELRAILRFAVTNKSNFCEHDPDGIKAAWIESAEDALLKE